MPAKPHSIRITNPVSQSHDFTSPARARSLVKRNRAIWANAEHTAITYSTSHRGLRETLRVAIGMQRAIIEGRQKAHLTGQIYDRVDRGMTLEEMTGVPIIKPMELLAPRGRMRPQPRGMSAATINFNPFQEPQPERVETFSTRNC